MKSYSVFGVLQWFSCLHLTVTWISFEELRRGLDRAEAEQIHGNKNRQEHPHVMIFFCSQKSPVQKKHCHCRIDPKTNTREVLKQTAQRPYVERQIHSLAFSPSGLQGRRMQWQNVSGFLWFSNGLFGGFGWAMSNAFRNGFGVVMS